MRLVAVTRIRNEDDIVEAFARHHAALVDHHVFLDNDSNDRTPDILRALRSEGLPLTLHTSAAATNAEAVQNTLLLHRAVALGADWVIHLDCDEFIDPRPLGGSLHDVLASVPTQAPCVHTGAVNYHPTALDDRAELVVPRRLRWRDAERAAFVKVFVRARAATAGASVGAGNHQIYLNGTQVPAFADPRLLLAHYYMRSGWQVLAKSLVGMMKILAAGQEAISRNTGVHYAPHLEHLRDNPHWLLADASFLDATHAPAHFGPGTLDDPIDYLGGLLRHTEPGNARLKAVRSVTACLEAVARSHGELADATEATRRIIEARAADFRDLA